MLDKGHQGYHQNQSLYSQNKYSVILDQVDYIEGPTNVRVLRSVM